MSDDEFVRCPECGNLNIKGTEKCVFCGAELPKVEGAAEKVETFKCPGCNTELPVTVETCPICGWSKEAEEAVKTQKGKEETPAVDETASIGIPTPSQTVETPPPAPGVPSISTPSETEIKEEPSIPVFLEQEVVEEEVEEKEEQVERKKSVVLLITFVGLVILLHFGINQLIGWVSISILDPNLKIFPTLGNNINEYIQVNTLSVIFQIVLAILVGFFFRKIILWYSPEKKKIYGTFVLLMVVDIIVNVAAAGILILLLSPKDILFTYLAGGVFEYLVVMVITLGIPYIVGAFAMYPRIHKILFPKRA
ncbi:MAG: zinc ribbon domain-containing protein [Candidatus Heimdallarchaeaceae archaeon]